MRRNGTLNVNPALLSVSTGSTPSDEKKNGTSELGRSQTFQNFRLKAKPKPINKPIENKFLQRFGNMHFRVGVCCMQGLREEMEDAHSVVLSMKHHEVGFFAIFDGHDGSATSLYCAEHMCDKLDSLDELTEEGIKQKLLELDSEMMKIPSGTTAVFAIVSTESSKEGRKVTIGNLGDSRCIMGHYTSPDLVCYTVDHKPELPSEASRILAAGGEVMNRRVDGMLAVARAFGDASYKTNPALPPDKQKIICVPDIVETYLGPDDFLLISCDGIFETFTNEMAIQFIHNGLKKSDDTAGILSEMLSDVLRRGSKDNMSAMIVQGMEGGSYAAKDEFIPGRWYTIGNETFQRGYEIDCRRRGLDFQTIKEVVLKKAIGEKEDEKSPRVESEEPSELTDSGEKVVLSPPGRLRNGITHSSRNLMAKLPPTTTTTTPTTPTTITITTSDKKPAKTETNGDKISEKPLNSERSHHTEKGNLEKTPNLEKSEKGNPEKTPNLEKSEKGNSERSPNSEKSEKGNSERSPNSEKSEKGNSERSPNSEKSEKGNSERSPSSEKTEKGNSERSPNSEKSEKGEKTNRTEREEKKTSKSGGRAKSGGEGEKRDSKNKKKPTRSQSAKGEGGGSNLKTGEKNSKITKKEKKK